MFKENAIIPTLTDAKASTSTKATVRPYCYNILTLSHAAEKTKIWFTVTDDQCSQRFPLHYLPENVRNQFTINGQPATYVYTHFDVIKDGIAVKLNLQDHPAIARAYYTKLIRDFLAPAADVVIPNFLNDTQFWFRDRSKIEEGFRIYKKYSLRVQTDKFTGNPELLISYDGISRVASKNLQMIENQPGFRQELTRKVIYSRRVYSYDKLPEEAKYNSSEVFPLLNRELIAFLDLQIPAKLNREKHKVFFDEMKWFYQSHLKSEEFLKLIPHHGKFKIVNDSDRYILNSTKTELVFGQGNTSQNIYEGFKEYGPYKLPSGSSINYFFIYDQNHPDGMKALQNSFINIYNKENRLKSFVKLSVIYRPELDIAFDGKADILQQISQRIRTMQLIPGQCYHAFFINQYTEWEHDLQNWKLYYKVKEELLLRNIPLQNIDQSKLGKNNISLYLPNLAVAMIGKLGGIPWKLERAGEDELIIGFGMSRSKKHKTAWMGSAFCFKNDGTFQQFDSFRAEETERLAAKVEEAVLKYSEANSEAKRIIIHFYRKLGRKALLPIEKMLQNLKVSIPVIIVSINKHRSNNLAVSFKENSSGFPLNGEYFRVANQQYLLYINDRDSYGDYKLSSMPMPLKINLWCNDETVIEDEDTVGKIFQQVHDFCFLYWRSVKHAKLPVTIAYPEMVAKILPWFEYKVLSGESEKSLWFL
ncbi:MAG: hypothetical protein EOM06_11820 [Sphingobacteriia bacterium]|nr:hypothetical protein [Sphingobacteriia bacterium]